jgi:HPt (histidine-containing phosphotransfer) domain-containing protein
MDDYIAKPIRREQLIETIQNHSGGQHLNEGAQAGTKASASSIDEFDFKSAVVGMDGDIDLLEELAIIFIQEFPQKINELEAAIRDGKASDVEHMARSLKGSAANLGFEVIYKKATEIEQKSVRKKLEGLDILLANLRKYGQKIEKLFRDQSWKKLL